MDKYFYHGVGDIIIEEILDKIITIIETGGLKTRDEVRKLGEGFHHVCLYKKNDDYVYDINDPNTVIRSVRGGWIDHCFFFIISPDIEAKKTRCVLDGVGFDGEKPSSSYVDEWRSMGDIPLDKIVGIAIPFDCIEEHKKEFPKSFKPSFAEKLNWIVNYAKTAGWMIENSDEHDLCERLDSELNSGKKYNLTHK